MTICRACGEVPDDQNELSESLEKYSEIYYNLTSIKLHPEERNVKRICRGCLSKLLEYDDFRKVCLQVHYRLTEIKSEVDLDRAEHITVDCQPFVEDLKVEQLEVSGSAPSENQLNDETADVSAEFPGCELLSEVDDSSDPDFEEPKTSQKSKKKPKKKSKDGKSIPQFECNICGKKFFRELRYQGHLRVHQGLKPALCTYCGKDFMKYNYLKLHITQKHSEDQLKFACDFPECAMVYTTKQGLKNHKEKHEPVIAPRPPKIKKFVCDQCGKTFSTTASLRKHSYTHTGDMPFQCATCEKKLPTLDKLKIHIMRHEGIKNHVCPHCGMKKTTRHELKVHMNYHTREKVYTCQVCAQKFLTVGNMTRHVKIVHCGIKAFSCTYCDRSFGKAETLKNHVMIHTGEKPHECSVCGKRFIQQVALQTHMKTHRKSHA